MYSQSSVEEPCSALVLLQEPPRLPGPDGWVLGLLFHHFSQFFTCLLICFLIWSVQRGHVCVHMCAHICGIQRTRQNASTILLCFALCCFVGTGSLTGLKLTKQRRLTVPTCSKDLLVSTPTPTSPISHPPPPPHPWAPELQASITMQDFLLY